MFAAGAGGKGGPERTKKVDYEGALKGASTSSRIALSYSFQMMEMMLINLHDHSLVFEAIKIASVNRFLLISAVDCRDRSQPPPSYYDEEDLQISDRMWGASASGYLRLAPDLRSFASLLISDLLPPS
jgi:hypothetical protein